MPRAATPALAGLAGLLACGGPAGDYAPPTGNDRPFRDQWRSAFSAPFPYDPESPDPGIERIYIGEEVADLGTTNRGNIIVVLDAPPQRIEVELRRFTFAGSEDAAQDGFDRIGLIAVDDEGHDCTTRWWDACTLTLTHAGQSEPLRSGADMRVHLPPDFRHRLFIRAHDVVDDSDYPDRADVCIDGLAGDAEISLDSGRAQIRLSDAATPAPTCTSAEVDACEAEDWTGCGCAFGRLAVHTRELGRADMRVDVPPGLWVSFSLSNVDTQGETCELALDVPGVEIGSVSDVHVTGEVARPAGAPDTSHGYGVELRSVQCSDVAFVRGPADFEMPDHERRGDLQVCSGCLGGADCEQLLDE